MIKDNLGATWRSTAEAIDRAEATSALRSDLDQIRRQNRWLETRTYLMQNYGCKPFSPEGENTTMTFRKKANSLLLPSTVNPEAIEGSFLEAHAHLETAKLLLEYLPSEPGLSARLANISKDLDEQETLLSEEKSKAGQDKQKMPTPFLLHINGSAAEKMDPYTPIGDALTLSSDTLDRAKQLRAEDAKRAHVAAVGTNFLFVLGWALGLVGKTSPKS